MILRDPVHGLISFEGEVESVVVRLLDTREVQRLRRIRSLGAASLAFPGAEHSRFSHAVGSAHVMKRYLQHVARLSSDIPARDRIDADDARVALAAALLHDLGHGPYSHTFEAVLPGALAHEDWTSKILLDPGTEVNAVLRAIDPAVPAMVERLIHGEHPIAHLARAVSGTFDVDRCDYLLRDSHMTGVRYGLLDLDWLLGSLRLDPSGSGTATLTVDGEKGLTAVEGFFLARLYMYRQVYLHKAVRAAEAVLRSLFRRLAVLGPQLGTPAPLQALLSGERIDVRHYLDLDDHALEWGLRMWSDADDRVLAELATRLRERRLFKTLRLRKDVPVELVRDRLAQVLRTASPQRGADQGSIDRVEIDAYIEDETLMIRSGGRLERLLEASPVLRGLSRERFVHYRAIFPPEVRDAVVRALGDLADLS
ncbi:MAG: HD domain-containing protein [Nannocystaceae bacterium]|jgi:HD superfamily phosphohydrolase